MMIQGHRIYHVSTHVIKFTKRPRMMQEKETWLRIIVVSLVIGDFLRGRS